MDVLIYLAKSSLYLILFYIFYRLLLRRTAFFHLNRAFLLLSLLLSPLLPLIEIKKEVLLIDKMQNVTADEGHERMVTSEHWTAVTRAIGTSDKPNPVMRMLIFLYLGGSLVSLSLVVRRLHLLSKLRRDYSPAWKGDVRVMVAGPNTRTGSFSYFGRIYMNRADFNLHFERIYPHEKVHAAQWHSVDMLLVSLLQTLFWFNPVIRRYRQELQEVHEFLADSSASDKESYATFLVSYALSDLPDSNIANAFANRNNLKNRIDMLFKKRDSKFALVSYLPVVPLIMLTVLLTASKQYVYVSPVVPLSAEPTIIPVEITQSEPTTEVSPSETKLIVLQTERIVKGTVTDAATGQPIPGVNVVIKNSHTGTTTDDEGKFSVSVLDSQEILAFSYVGYATKSVNIGEATTLSVAMVKEKKQLKEIVVIGYGAVTNHQEAATKNEEAVSGSSPVFTAVEQMPEFPGGQTELYKYFARNIRYPGEASRANIQGKVYISFIINKNGFVRSPKVVNGLGYGTDEEALRVVISMPKWQPGKQNGKPVDTEYTLPVIFRLETQATPEKQGSVQPSDRQSPGASTPGHTGLEKSAAEISASREAPLIVVDGKKYGSATDKLIPTSINPNDIQLITVLKDSSAIEKYGKKGKNGVVIITTKKVKN